MEGPATRTRDDRHVQFVKKIAESIKRQIGTPMEVDELVSCGYLGLREALDRYDPGTNVKFETFAYYRIRGAMFEGITRQCNLSRHMAQKIKLARKANDYMEGASADAAGRESRSPAANASFVSGIIRDLTCVFTLSSLAHRLDEDGRPVEMEFPDEASASKHEEAVRRSELRGFLDRLPPDQAEIMRLYYYEDMTLEEAGRKLGFQKSWAWKLHNSAIKKLRRLMEERGT